MIPPDTARLLLQKADEYNQRDFITLDPVSIPHRYSQRQDIEISGLFAATLAWGQRKSILASLHRLMALLEDEPWRFITQSSEGEWSRFDGFVHRTFNSIDLLYFLRWLRWWYGEHNSLEEIFVIRREDDSIRERLIDFHRLFFSLPDYPQRTCKHIATPARNSACKRLNMYLRWMVRRDSRGVDLGLWTRISPADLIIPMDVHVSRVAHRLGLIERPIANWETAEGLTAKLRSLDPLDPVRFDFALFGLGIAEGWAKD